MKNKTARYGVLTGLALIFSYVERVASIDVGVPGVKVGLANIVAIVCLYLYSAKEAYLVNTARIALSALLFRSLLSFVYGLSGGLLSVSAMVMAKKTGLFSVIGVSVIGGVLHNVGQLIAAAFVMNSIAVFSYLPVLIISGGISGAVIGAVSGIVYKRLH